MEIVLLQDLKLVNETGVDGSASVEGVCEHLQTLFEVQQVVFLISAQGSEEVNPFRLHVEYSGVQSVLQFLSFRTNHTRT